MSQKELEQGDKEVMAVVNDHSHPDAAATAEGICREQQERTDERKIYVPPVAGPDKDGRTDRAAAQAAECRRRILLTAIKVMVCVLIGCLFVAAMVDPGFVVHLVNIGVLVCGCVAAVIVDRFVRRR